MKEFLQVQLEGWTATPRLPFVLSGNAICMPTPSHSMLLGMIGCCLGRIVEANEVNIGFYYAFDTSANDLETRHRIEKDKGKLKPHAKGPDAYSREFHINPKLTIWLSRTDWQEAFKFPKGTPTLGRSQDLLKVKSVKIVQAKEIKKAIISGCMLPFSSHLNIGGQLVQLVESYVENDKVGGGRTPVNSKIFMSIPADNKSEIEYNNLYQTEVGDSFYLHTW